MASNELGSLSTSNSSHYNWDSNGNSLLLAVTCTLLTNPEWYLQDNQYQMLNLRAKRAKVYWCECQVVPVGLSKEGNCCPSKDETLLPESGQQGGQKQHCHYNTAMVKFWHSPYVWLCKYGTLTKDLGRHGGLGEIWPHWWELEPWCSIQANYETSQLESWVRSDLRSLLALC